MKLLVGLSNSQLFDIVLITNNYLYPQNVLTEINTANIVLGTDKFHYQQKIWKVDLFNFQCRQIS